MDNRHGLVVHTQVTRATATAERETAVELLAALPPRAHRTVGADKGYDTAACVQALRAAGVTPHIAQKPRGSALDRRTTHHPGYAVSQRKRKCVEEIFGWLKTVAGLRKTRHRGVPRVAAYNLIRMRNLAGAPA